MSKQKLELTWIGKDEKLEIEPRILVEDKKLSNISQDENTENILIHGDNLLALKALESKFAGQVKCIYIDPPYNTGAAFEYYDDNLEHSIWLSLMKERLYILKNLLSEDGFIFVQIDDSEQAYLTVLMDEIFGRDKRVNTICVNMNSLSGVKMTHAISGKRYPAQKEYILLYKASSKSILKIEKLHKEKWDKEYNLIIPELARGEYEKFSELTDGEVNCILSKMNLISLNAYAKSKSIELTDEWKWENSYRIFGSKSNRPLATRMRGTTFNQDVIAYTNTNGDKRYFMGNFNRTAKDPRIELVQAEANSTVFLSDNWIDISTDGGVAQEGNVSFPKGKKPEILLERIIFASTEPNDIVLDSFLGSGTTSAVAHKLGRSWIGIEMGEHAYTHCKPRMDQIIEGLDQSGISTKVEWQGGGGYRFYELAPTLIQKDILGVPVINEFYNADMLASAVALHEGYTYSPDETIFWKQAKGTESSYLYVTTNHIDDKYLKAISSTMNENEHLLIACTSFDEIISNKYSNISVRKIPQMLLAKCEYKEEGYPLNIISPPVIDNEEEEYDE